MHLFSFSGAFKPPLPVPPQLLAIAAQLDISKQPPASTPCKTNSIYCNSFV